MNKGTWIRRSPSETQGGMVRSLKEEEMLLIEFHRRIEDNLKIIMSLLQLKIRHCREQGGMPVFKRSRERVRVADRTRHNSGSREGLL